MMFPHLSHPLLVTLQQFSDGCVVVLLLIGKRVTQLPVLLLHPVGVARWTVLQYSCMRVLTNETLDFVSLDNVFGSVTVTEVRGIDMAYMYMYMCTCITTCTYMYYTDTLAYF